MDPNLKLERIAPVDAQDDEDDHSNLLFHVTVDQFDENEEEIVETLRSQIKILVEDERVEARKMLSTFGADDEEDEIGEDNKADTPKPRKQAEPRASVKKAPKAKGKPATDKTQNGTLMDLTPKNLKQDAVF